MHVDRWNKQKHQQPYNRQIFNLMLKTKPAQYKQAKEKSTLRKQDALNVSVDLFSRAAARQVSSALKSLTTVFGMGTGGPSS